METNYEVIEYRGCGIEYSVFQGTYHECGQWLEDNCAQDLNLMWDLDWVSKDPSCVNGNGFSFKYNIRKISE